MNPAHHTVSPRRVIVTVVVALGALVLMAGSASAHITTIDPEGPAGGYLTTAFQISHGCDDQPTTKVEIRIPAGVTSVAPRPVPGWELSMNSDTVTWEGGPLPVDQLELFWMSMKLPDGKSGEQIAFPIIQTCGATQTEWISIPKEGEPEPEHPAAVITLTAPTEGAGTGRTDESESNSGTDPLVILAFVFSLAGVGLGGAALAMSSAGVAARKGSSEKED